MCNSLRMYGATVFVVKYSKPTRFSENVYQRILSAYERQGGVVVENVMIFIYISNESYRGKNLLTHLGFVCSENETSYMYIYLCSAFFAW